MGALFLILLVASASALRVPVIGPYLQKLPLVGQYFDSTPKVERNMNSVGEALSNLGKFMQDLIEGIRKDVDVIVGKITQINANGVDINFMVNGVNNGILSAEIIKDMIKGMSFPLCDLVEEIIYPVMKVEKKLEDKPEKIKTTIKDLLSLITTLSFGRLEREQQLSAVDGIIAKMTQNEMKVMKKILDEMVVDMKEAEQTSPTESEETTTVTLSPVTVPPEEKVEL